MAAAKALTQAVTETKIGVTSDATRVNVALTRTGRTIVGILAVAALGFGSYLAIVKADGVATAAVFAVALLCGVVALGGALPSSVKVGDIEVAIDQAKQEGKEEGLTAGVAAAAHIATSPRPGIELDKLLQVAPSLGPNLNLSAEAAASEPAEWREKRRAEEPVAAPDLETFQ